MRVNSIMPKISVNYANNDSQYNSVASFKHQELRNLPVGFYNDYNIRPAEGISVITFTGNTEKNMNQIASLCFENKATGLAEDYQGGMGVVTMEGPLSMNKYEGMDVRSFIPFHEYDNPNGGYKFLITKHVELVDGRLPDEIEAKWFRSAAPGVTLEQFAASNHLSPADVEYVIQSKPNSKGPEGKSRYVLIEPTSVKGSFERMDDFDIGKTKTVNYQLFRFADDNPPYVKLNKNNYWVYTSEFAKTPKPYTYGPEGWDGMSAEIINSDYNRAVAESLKQMNTEEFGYYNPASVWGHDRTAAWFYKHVADASARGDNYFDGTISHHTLHNPRRTYQGNTYNPFDFARAIFSTEDVRQLAQSPNYDILQSLSSRGWDNLTDAEREFARKEFEPFIGVFKDYFGSYNVSKIPVVAKMLNPNNMSVGTVSPGFEREIYNPDMDAAPGLGEDFRKINMTSPLNGSTPANLHIDRKDGRFGAGHNVLTDRIDGYTPLHYNGNNIDEIIANREKNAVWFTDILKEAEGQGRDALNRVFYNDVQIEEEGCNVKGSLSNYKKGDMLVMGWGRPDEQKGFPITIRAIREFYERPDVPEEVKMRTNFAIGWGRSPFNKNSREWKLIEPDFNRIMTMENGKYANSLLLADGMFPNKLVACATHTLFTSRGEMCGITPFESWSAGVPSGVTATGGPNGYVTPERGWKTKTAPEMNPTYDGLTWDASADVIDDARVNRSAAETSEMLKDMTHEYFYDNDSYRLKNKNVIDALTDWHNNGKLNGGKSANRMYIEDIWRITEGWGGRDKTPMRRLMGQSIEAIKAAAENAPETVSEAAEQLASEAQKVGSRWTKVVIGTGVALATVGGISYGLLRSGKSAANAATNTVNSNAAQKLNQVA